jgi:hypothetical protein
MTLSLSFIAAPPQILTLPGSWYAHISWQAKWHSNLTKLNSDGLLPIEVYTLPKLSVTFF